MRYFSFCLLLLFFGCSVSAQNRAVIAFWNTENLMDTIRSIFYDDSAWTPPRWNTVRYEAKIAALARVIDDLGADIIGLAEVENETVMRDLVLASGGGYNYIHRTSSDKRGIDLALLYHGDRFFPKRTELINSGFGREFMHVTGTIDTLPISLLLCHMPSQLNERAFQRRVFERLERVADSLLVAEPNLIIIGDFNATPQDKIYRRTIGQLGLVQGVLGAGTYAYRGRWQLFDQILIATALKSHYLNGGIFVRDYMLVGAGTRAGYGAPSGSRRGYPRRTFNGSHYEGGASDHLPVYIELIVSSH